MFITSMISQPEDCIFSILKAYLQELQFIKHCRPIKFPRTLLPYVLLGRFRSPDLSIKLKVSSSDTPLPTGLLRSDRANLLKPFAGLGHVERSRSVVQEPVVVEEDKLPQPTLAKFRQTLFPDNLYWTSMFVHMRRLVLHKHRGPQWSGSKHMFALRNKMLRNLRNRRRLVERKRH